MVQVEVWGDYACFSRLEMSTERVSYDVITPSAARGILESIYWHPGLKWVIDKITVCNPIQFVNIRRNEVGAKISARNVKGAMEKGNAVFLATSKEIQQRATMALKNVRYIIEAHFEMTQNATESDNPGKFQDIMRRRLEKGQCFHMPYFGVREFPVKFAPFQKGEKNCPRELAGEKDLGYMLYDMDYSDLQNITPMYFRAKMVDGVIDLREAEVIK